MKEKGKESKHQRKPKTPPSHPPASGAWTTEWVLLKEERNAGGKERAGIGKERRKETQLCF